MPKTIYKIEYNSKIKQFASSELKFNELLLSIESLFPQLKGHTQEYELQFIDKDNERITVSSEEDLECALLSMQITTIYKFYVISTLPLWDQSNSLKISDHDTVYFGSNKEEPKHNTLWENTIREIAKEQAKLNVKQTLESIYSMSIAQSKPEPISLPIDKPLIHEDMQTAHIGVLCDGCRMNPIKGPRFKCTQCDDYDLCYECEKKGIHKSHVFLKINFPKRIKAVPQPIIPKIPTSIEQIKELIMKKTPFIDTTDRHDMATSKKFGVMNLHIVANPGEKVFAKLKVVNNSKLEWSRFSVLSKKSGVLTYDCQVFETSNMIPKAGNTFNLELTAPTTEGKYFGRYLFYGFEEPGSFVSFGNDVNIYVIVKRKEDIELKCVAGASTLADKENEGTFEYCFEIMSKFRGNLEKARNYIQKLKRKVKTFKM